MTAFYNNSGNILALGKNHTLEVIQDEVNTTNFSSIRVKINKIIDKKSLFMYQEDQALFKSR